VFYHQYARESFTSDLSRLFSPNIGVLRQGIFYKPDRELMIKHHTPGNRLRQGIVYKPARARYRRDN
jgi:hypothetical protein